MHIVALALAGLAAVLHVYIWYLESLTWTTPATRAIFRTTEEEAEATRFLAFNQGFYNLFLGLVAGAGIVAYVVGEQTVGRTLIYAGAGSMVAAAAVLGLSSRGHRTAALRQGLLPAVALVLLLLGKP